ncbi:DUF2946 family protein [Sinimarinibacterium sp. NLF-5-8]|uniref:DUF2946 family protein n=1 Tax=Sinimarinibacterium sp. NLF-5-8 TaxID=2698684 RepID=UPI00137BBC6F|nr:DUF2946 family protein [Sinimarinibacterium sp. NLF-5-8]QHS11021.1 hypothetical protein GT972_13285 [Sinimarinibacterium sp. NLF-5-8]
MNRSRPIAHLLSWLALLAQLWLPLAHASAYAQHLRDGAGAVHCAVEVESSPVTLHPHLQSPSSAAGHTAHLAQCHCCAAFHGSALPGTPLTLPPTPLARHEAALPPVQHATPAHTALPPPARAPPLI